MNTHQIFITRVIAVVSTLILILVHPVFPYAGIPDSHSTASGEISALPFTILNFTIQQRIDSGETPKQIFDSGLPLDSLFGKTYQGGLIFYMDTITGDGMVSAPGDQSNGAVWGSAGTCTSGSSVGIGLANTAEMVLAQGPGNYAGYLCDTLTIGGYTDWFLPDRDELSLMRQNLFMNDMGTFSSGYVWYWCSTSIPNWDLTGCNDAMGHYFYTPAYWYVYGLIKSELHYVRAARSFCLHPPTASNAGFDIINDLDTVVTLSANPATVGTGIWTMADGIGGSFENPETYNTKFSGNKGTSYILVWSITNFCGEVSRDTVNISFVTPTLPSQIVYVTPTGSGIMNGCSWDNALNGNIEAGNGFTKLAQTMRWMATPGTQFWIAEGTYKVCTDNDREKSFELPQNVKIFGGFEGIESDTAQRNIAEHSTIFSGDIGIPNDSTDNTRIILKTISLPWSNYSLVDGADFEGANNVNGLGSGIYNTGILVVRDCDFRKIYSIGEGAGIHNAGNLDVKNCLFHNNTANLGGGIYNSAASAFFVKPSANIKTSAFANNTANAGAAICNNGTMHLVSCNITDNKSFGAISNSTTGVFFGDSLVIENNDIIGYSNGIQFLAAGIVNHGLINLKSSSISNNSGNYWEQAGLYNGGNATLINCSILNNNAGALNNTDSIFLINCRIDSTHSSGGAFLNTGYADMLNCSMSYDTSGTLIPGLFQSGSPGGILNQGTLRMKGSILKNNFAAGPGGAIRNSGYLSIDSSWFEKNNSGVIPAQYIGGFLYLIEVAAQFSGGAIHNSAGQSVITNSVFNDNRADYGGAIASMAGNVTLVNCKLVRNFSLIGGAALFNHGQMDIRNCLYANNYSDAAKPVGGIIACGKGSKFQFRNCDIVNNSSSKFLVTGVDEYETYQFDPNLTPDTVLISNSIIWGNDTLVNNPNASLISSVYSCSQQVFEGTGNLHTDPLFLNPTLGNDTSYNALEADWRLFAYSPCINAGADSLCNDSTDIIRNQRKYNRVDIGAYENLGIIEIKAFPEGLYNASTHSLNKSRNASGEQFGGAIADKISLELHQSTAPFSLIGTALPANLLTSGYAHGMATTPLPDSFYIVVKQRNSIETWSSAPVTPVNGLVKYDFTQHINAAYGNNLKPIGSYFGIFSGDVNQDGVVDALDMIAVDNLLAPGENGYIPEDTNGDGVIDAADMGLIDGNAGAFVRRIVPE